MRTVLLILLCLFSAAAFGQKISVRTIPDSAMVYIDSSFAGYSPLIDRSLDTGRHRIQIFDNITKWNRQNLDTTMNFIHGDVKVLEFAFKSMIEISAEPFETKIFLNSEYIGGSPQYIRYRKGDSLVFKCQLYETQNVLLDTIKNNKLNIKLIPLIGNNLKIRNGKNNIYYYLIGGGLLFGISSVISKNKADDFEERYRNSLNPNDKQNIRTFDALSSISLTIFEVCFLSLSYLLLSD